MSKSPSWPFSDKDPSETHSWIYWFIRKTPAVNRLFWIFACGIAGPCLVVLAIILFHRTQNVVEHIADPILWHDYTAGGISAMAASGNWLAVSNASQGVTIFSKSARMPAAAFSGNTLDIAPAPDGGFAALQADGGIDTFRHSLFFWYRSTMLKAPRVPFWPAAGQNAVSPEDVVWSQWDQDGLLLAVRGAGLARHMFASSDGVSVRTRSWLVGDFASTALDQVVPTNSGFWITLQSGGIRFADLHSLASVPARSRETPPIVNVGAARSGDWATAVDNTGAAWLYRSPSGWTGPWFGFSGSLDAPAPQEASTVLAARLLGTHLWLGTNASLLDYDTESHHMSTVVARGQMSQIEPAHNGLLAAGNGLFFISSSGAVTPLESSPVTELQISPSGDTAVFHSETSDDRTPYIGIWNTSTQNVKHINLGSGPSLTPVISDVAQYGGSVVLASPSHCLIYSAEGAHYENCSRDLSAPPITRLIPQDRTILAATPTETLVLNPSHSWTVLDPAHQFRVRRWTAVGDGPIGLTEDGQIVSSDANGFSGVSDVLNNTASTFQIPATGGPFTGDLIGDKDHWKALISSGQVLHLYDSATSDWSEMKLEFVPAQAGFSPQGIAVVTPSGTLQIGTPGQDSFGSGGLPFSPQQVATMTLVDDTVVAGSFDGRVTRYIPASGSWQDLPSLPGGLLRLEQTPRGLLAAAPGGHVFVFNNGNWQQVAGMLQWASGDDFITLDDSGLTHTGGNAATAFSFDPGMRDIVDRSSFIWQIDDDRVAFLAKGTIGVLDRRNVAWFTISTDPTTPLRAFPFSHDVLIFDGSRIVHLDNNLRSSSISSPLNTPLLDIAPSASGKDHYWILARGLAQEFYFKDDSFVALHPALQIDASINSLAAAAHAVHSISLAASPSTGATLSFGDEHLDWNFNAQGHIGVSWRGRPGLPVWGSCGKGRLALQCIQDFALDNQHGALRLATEDGAVSLALSSFHLLSLAPGTQPALAALRPAPSFDSGPFHWSLSSNVLAVSLSRQSQSWLPYGGRWRLQSDVVTGFETGPSDTLILRTEGQSWSWSSSSGRIETGSASTRAPAVIETPAMRISLRGSSLSFDAFDRGPALINGRFFFDSVSDIQGQNSKLYLLADNRAVVERSATDTHAIIAAWSLPAAAGHFALAPGSSGVRIVGNDSSFELSSNDPSAQWHPASALPDPSTGPFTWSHSPSGWSVTMAVGNRRVRVPSWWSENCFSWDRVLAAGAVNGGLAALSTPLGILLRSSDTSILDIIPAPPLSSSATARDNEVTVGTLFTNSTRQPKDASPTQFLLSTRSADRLTLIPASSGMNQKSSVEFGHIPSPSLPFPVLGFSQLWISSNEPLRSSVDSLPASALFSRGRFAFDQLSSAAQLGDTLLTVSACSATGGCLFNHFQFDHGKLYLTELYRSDTNIVRFMASSDGGVFGQTSSTTYATAFTLGPHSSLITSPVLLASTADAFSAGDVLRLDVDRLTFSHSPTFFWNSSPRLTTTVKDFPVFFRKTSGLAFSFDVFTSLAVDPSSGELALATPDGTFLCPRNARIDPEPAQACSFLRLPPTGEASFSVSRLRFSQDHILWALAGDKSARLIAGRWTLASTDAPFFATSAGDVHVRFPLNGVLLGSTMLTASDNLWNRNQTPFTQIVDSDWDPTTGTLWLCDRNNGLFAVTISPSDK